MTNSLGFLGHVAKFSEKSIQFVSSNNLQEGIIFK